MGRCALYQKLCFSARGTASPELGGANLMSSPRVQTPIAPGTQNAHHNHIARTMSAEPVSVTDHS
jgi:hypothetical protein